MSGKLLESAPVAFTIIGSDLLDGVVTTDLSRPTLAGTASANELLRVSLDGVVVGQSVSDTNGNWSFTLPQSIGGGHHSLSVSDATSDGSGAAAVLDINRLTTDLSTTGRYLLVKDPTNTGPKMAFGAGQVGTLNFAPGRVSVLGPDNGWFLVQWVHGATLDPAKYTTDNAAVIDPTLGNPEYTFDTSDRETQLNVYSQYGGTMFTFDLRQNGGRFVGAGACLLMQAQVSNYSVATLDHPITFALDVKLSEATAAAAPGMSIHNIGISLCAGLTFNFNQVGSAKYDPSLPSYGVLFQIPFSQTPDELTFLFPGSYGLHLGAGATESQTVAGEILPGAPELALQADGGPLHHLSFNVNAYLCAMLEQSTYTDPVTGQQMGLPPAFLDLSRWDLGAVYIGSEVTNQFPSELSGTVAAGLTFADYQLSIDPTKTVTYSALDLSHQVPMFVLAPTGPVPTPLAGSGAPPTAPTLAHVQVSSANATVTGHGDPGDLIVVSFAGNTVGHAIVGSDGSWSLVLTSLPPSGVAQLSATAYDAYGASNPSRNAIEILNAGGNMIAVGGADLAIMTPAQVSNLTPQQIAAFTLEQMAALTGTQLAAFGVSQIAALTIAQIASMSAAQIAGLSPGAIGGFSRADITALTLAQIPALTPLQMGSLSVQQVNALTVAQVGALGASQIAAISPSSFAGLLVAVLSIFTPTQAAALTVQQINALSAQQASALAAARNEAALIGQTPAVPVLAPASDSGVLGDGITNVARPTVTGRSVVGGDTITLYDGVTVIGSATVNADGSWAMTPAIPLPNGAHSLTVIETGPAGERSAASPAFALTIDATAPATPPAPALVPASDSGTPADGFTNVTRPTITGRGTAGDTVTLYDGVMLAGSTTVCADGSWAVTPTAALADGPHSFSITETDIAGNVSPASSTLALTIDAIAPAAPATPVLDPASDSGVQGDGITNVIRPTLTGRGTAGDIITLYDHSLAAGTVIVGADGTWSVQPGSVLANGAHSLYVTETDAVSNVSAASPALSLAIDTAAPVAPAAPVLARSSDSGILSDGVTDVVRPTLTGRGIPGDIITLYDGDTGVGSEIVGADGSWAVTPATALVIGAHSLSVIEADIAGNVSAASPALSLTIDAAAPVAPTAPVLISPSDSGIIGDSITNVTRPTVGGQGAAGDIITLYDAGKAVGSAIIGGDGSWAVIPAAALADGAHSLVVTETDPVGNVSDASPALALTIDTTAPSAPAAPALGAASDGGIPGDGITNVVRPTIIGRGATGDTVTLYDGTTAIGSATVNADGGWAVAPATAFGNGTHILSTTETDLAGNVSSASPALSLTIDTSATTVPSALMLAPSSDSGTLSDSITNVTRPTITGQGAPGDTAALYDGAAVIGSATVGADGSWAVTPAVPLAQGRHSLSAVETDVAGNVSAASIALLLTIDVVAPDTPTLAQTEDSTAPAKPELVGMTTAGSKVHVSDGAELLGSTTADADGHWAFDVPTALSVGTHALTAFAVDVAGNVSSASDPLFVSVAADCSYQIVSPPTVDGETIDRHYDSTGVLTQVDARDDNGRVLRTVDGSRALLNIYDADGILTGTVVQPASSPNYQPTFKSSGNSQTLATSTGNAGSTVSLKSGNHVIDSEGSDRITTGSGADTVFASGQNVTVTGGVGTLLFVGGNGSSTVTGGAGSAAVFGGAGGGYLEGGSAGHNLLLAGGGNTTLVGGGTGDILVAGTGETTITMQPDSFAFGNSGMTVFHGADNGLLVGGSGDALMIAGPGTESLFAGSGNSTLIGGSGNDVLAGSNAGRTKMTGGTGNATFVGFGGAVTATGGGGDDTFFTGAGPMQIIEGPGNDKVAFSAGSASVTGGSGIDEYIFVNGAARTDMIANFKVGTDRIELYGYDPGQVGTHPSGGSTAITLQDGTRILLVGATQLAPDSIITA